MVSSQLPFRLQEHIPAAGRHRAYLKHVITASPVLQGRKETTHVCQNALWSRLQAELPLAACLCRTGEVGVGGWGDESTRRGSKQRPEPEDVPASLSHSDSASSCLHCHSVSALVTAAMHSQR